MNLPNVPAQLKPPNAEELVLVARANGFQIYRWDVAPDGMSAWVLKAPAAELRDGEKKLIGSHFAGPTWRLSDGSQISGKVMAKSDSQDANAIPWLLLSVTGREGSGALSLVTWIQRIHTRGGLAPESTGKSSGEEVRVSYSADYYFYAPAEKS